MPIGIAPVSYPVMKTGTDTLEQRYCFFASNCAAFTTANKSKDTLHYILFEVEETINIDRLGAEVSTAGTTGSVFRIGIYKTTNFIPSDNPITGSEGTINGDSQTIQEYTASCRLTPGIYSYAWNHNSSLAIGLRTINIGSQKCLNGIAPTLGSWTTAMSVAQTYGVGYTLPTPATAPTTRMTASQPAIIHRAAI